jgi:glucosamine-6-phosphate deaminase
MEKIYTYSRKELITHGKVLLDIVDTEEDLYLRMAQDVIDEIIHNNKQERRTVLILPVGPIEQYEKIVEMVNTQQINLKNVIVFNMDEYLENEIEYIPKDHTLSFRGFMEREFYNKIHPSLTVLKENRIFPEPGNEENVWNKIQEWGGVDLCQGGFGINGHIAFNEPPEESLDNDTFREYATRVLPISLKTRVINSVKIGGCFDLMPRWCITVGMKEILSSRKLRFYLNKNWQWAVLRKVLFEPVTPRVPGSFLQEHENAKIIATAEAADLIQWSK